MDSELSQLVHAIFGDGAEEIVSKIEQSETERKLGLATNVASVVAGPAAIWQATKAAKENQGGIPRDLATTVARRSPNSRAGKTAAKAVTALNTRKGKVGAAGATAAAGGLVALQGLNWVGDAIATRSLASQKPSEKVVKSSPGPADLHAPGGEKKRVYLTRGILTAMAAEKAAPAVGEGAKKTVPVIVDQGRRIKANTEAKIKKSDDLDLTWEGEFAKFDTDKRQVFGWASITEINGEPVIDLQGDYITTDEIEKAAYDYVRKSRKGGDMHRRDGDQPYHVSDMIESFMVTDEKKKQMGLPDSVPTGWWVGFQVNDDATWDLVKKGERKGFSIHGRGKRVPLDD